MGYDMTLEHLCYQTIYIACMGRTEDPSFAGGFKAEFEFDNDRVTRVGLHLEADSGLVWFDRVEGEQTVPVR